MSIIKDYKFYFDNEAADEYPESYNLLIDFESREVTTNCGDFYYDYSFSFDDIIKVAEYIKEEERKQHDTIRNNTN